jgi:hypothetical protein
MSPEHHTTNDNHTFWASPAFKALDDHLNNVLTEPDGNTYVLMSSGFDGMQLLIWGTRTESRSCQHQDQRPATTPCAK